jgi:thymidine phosphorylase
LQEELRSGRAYETFCRYVAACGGEAEVLAKPDQFISRAHKLIVKSPQSGYIDSIATNRLGFLAGKLGAGRSAMTDRIDPLAGIEMKVRIGSRVVKGEPLAVGYTQTESRLSGFDRDFTDCLTFSAQSPRPERLILKRL